MTPPMPPPIWYPSGFLDSIYISSGVVLVSVYPGAGCDTLLYITSGTYVKIFEGFNGTYLFNTPSGVIFSEDNLEWNKVATSADYLAQIDTSQTTILFRNFTNTTTRVYSQVTPESPTGWVWDTTLSGTTTADVLSDADAIVSSILPTLVGNSKSNVYPRVQRNTERTKPISIFTKSDTGIPQVTPNIAQITDLEAL